MNQSLSAIRKSAGMTQGANNVASNQGNSGKTGGRDWQALATIGDVRRMLRFCILEVKRGRMSTRKANCLGFLGSHLITCIETEELERRITQLEADRGSYDGGWGNDGGVLNISVSR